MTFKQTTATALFAIFGIGTMMSARITTDEAGVLETLVENAATETTLAVSGPINAADLFFIGNNMPALRSLDLSAATIEGYNNSRLNGSTTYSANTIPPMAFALSGIESVTLPATATITISDGAFTGSALRQLPALNNVDSIGDGAFSACKNLTAVDMPLCRLGTSVFENCENLATVNITGAVSVPARTFRDCTALTAVNNSELIEAIGQQAFEGDTSLDSFNFGKNLTAIGASAFAGSGLTQAAMEHLANITVIEPQAFASSALSEVSLPMSLAEIGDGAFFGNACLESISLPEDLIKIGQYAFVGMPLQHLDMPVGLEEISHYALLGQSGITHLVLPHSLIYIGDYAMEGMTGLTKIDVTALPLIPELGEDVWAGVDKPNVVLSVSEDSPDFSAADQWKDFDIDVKSGATEVLLPEAELPAVRGRFVGTVLQIESIGSDIAAVRLFDTNGRLLASSTPRDTTATLETADFAGPIFIVSLTLESGHEASLKLARK